jgi:hypothetical protein
MTSDTLRRAHTLSTAWARKQIHDHRFTGDPSLVQVKREVQWADGDELVVIGKRPRSSSR